MKLTLRKAFPYLLSLVALTLGARLYLMRRAENTAMPDGAFIGSRAPGFKLSDLGGKVVSLSDYRGRPVLVNFFATWCPGCVEETPDLEAFYKRHQKDGLAILSLSVDDTKAPVMSFVARENPTYQVLMCDDKTAHAYDVYGLPASFLVSPDGVITAKYEGEIPIPEAENDILKLLPRRT